MVMTYIIGVPKEIKAHERRVSLIPQEVQKIVEKGFKVYVQKDAGELAGYPDNDYIASGAVICETAEEVFSHANVIVKVKEPLSSEYPLITDKHTIFSFFHFASCPELLQAMVKSKATCVAYETIQANGTYPILAPMSVIAGQHAMIQAVKHVEFNEDDEVTIIGAGNVGQAAAYKAKELGYNCVNLVDKAYDKIAFLQGFNAYKMTDDNLYHLTKKSKIVVGSVYNTGEKAAKLISDDLLDVMQDGSIIMDVAIDQGGMTEHSKPTTISEPIVMYKNIKLYCVPNIPSQAANDASCKISEAVYPYLCTLLDASDFETAIEKSAEFASGVNIKNGNIYHKSLL